MPSKLALFGGERACPGGPPAWPIHDSEDEQALVSVCRSGVWWLPTQGQGHDLGDHGIESQVLSFQREFAACHGARYAIATSSGTATLDAAVRALDAEPGDEIIVPAYTYVATATCALQNGLVPVFVDISPETYNIDPVRVEEAITRRTRAVIPVHFGGQLCDMDRLCEIAGQHGLAIIEDAAHAHGSEWRGSRSGSFGLAGAFSFQASKGMTAGEGGALVTNDDEFAEKFESLIWGGRKLGRPWYEVHELGWNYRMTEFQGAVLRVQLRRLASQNAQRSKGAALLSNALLGLEGVSPLVQDPRANLNSFHLYGLRYDEEAVGLPRDRFIEALRAEGVPAFSGYETPLYSTPLFLNSRIIGRYAPRDSSPARIDYEALAERCPVVEKACRSEAILLPHNVLLADCSYIEAVADGIRKVIRHAGELGRRSPR